MNASATRPAVIPTSQVVILREDELDCDLATAIRRVRDSADTARSRILVVGPDDEGEGTVARAVDRPLPRAPTTIGQVVRRAEEAANRRLGERFDGLVQCLQRFLEEARWAVRDLRDATGAEAGSDTDPCRVIAEVLEWSTAVAQDLDGEARRAREGLQPVTTLDLVQEMAGQVEAHFPDLQITVTAMTAPGSVWGRSAELAEAFFLGLILVAQRIGGRGSIRVEIAVDGDQVVHRLQGGGEPVEVRAPEAVARFRQLVRAHQGQVVHDGLGPHSTGLTIRLPRIL